MKYTVFDNELKQYHGDGNFVDSIDDAVLFTHDEAKNIASVFRDSEIKPVADDINMAMFNNTPPIYEIKTQSDLRAEWNDTFNAALTGLLIDKNKKNNFQVNIALDIASAADIADFAEKFRAEKFGG